MHVAIAADDRATVDAFHRAALAAGGKDNGAPGLRPQYHPDYYGAFVLDPDGHNVEAVCHAAGCDVDIAQPVTLLQLLPCAGRACAAAAHSSG